jgi:hypothetical protein
MIIDQKFRKKLVALGIVKPKINLKLRKELFQQKDKSF